MCEPCGSCLGKPSYDCIMYFVANIYIKSNIAVQKISDMETAYKHINSQNIREEHYQTRTQKPHRKNKRNDISLIRQNICS